MLLLAIETSCDETAAAVVRDGKEILSNVVASQVAIHADYGGVVPEIASRKHLESIIPVVQEALRIAGTDVNALQGVAVTQGPGLVGALLVGIAAARGIAAGLRIPVVGVNHIESHLLASFLEYQVDFPFLALVVSGGHSHLYRVDGIGSYTTMGQTLDDAAGEAFDKVAKLLGMPYPGGALIDRLAADGDPSAIKLPRPLLHDGTCNFSFSGLKTAVLTWVQKQSGPIAGQMLADLSASFQQAVCDVLVAKTAHALKLTGLERLVVAGGVACNSALRHAVKGLVEQRGYELYIPSPALCADNAAMVAVPGNYYLSHSNAPVNRFDALPSWPLDRISDRLQFIVK